MSAPARGLDNNAFTQLPDGAQVEEAESMVSDGEFIPYPDGFLRFLYEMRGSFGFPTK